MTGTAQPLVTVVMPVFNAGEYLRPAVLSVLGQTWSNWELIIIDDGSTDGCMATIADLADSRIQRFRQENAGKPAAMNRALARAKGEFWAILDADDIGYPRRLELQAHCLIDNPDVAGVFCGYDVILDGVSQAPVLKEKSREECAKDISQTLMPGHDPTAMYRRSMTAGFDYAEDLPIVEGFDFILRLGEARRFLAIKDVLYGYRIHFSSVTRRDPGRRNRMVVEVLRRVTARRGLPEAWLADIATGIGKGPQDHDNGMLGHFTISVADQVLAGHRLGSLRTGLRCWRLRPLHLAYAKPLLYALFPRWLMRAYRRARARQQERRWAELTAHRG